MGESGKSRTDFMASEDDNVIVMGVARDRNALGYVGMAHYLANQDRLRSVSVVPAAGGCLLYTSPSPRDRQKSRMPSSA